ncbi:MAG TPA: ABC transporter ATP-binding protein [Bryobacteraceae bacterium]|nr:ABC transporter ATP-binding protein [Bryobacteraceae bacterium]
MSAILRTIDLEKRFGGTKVLNRLNLEVPDGSVYALIGPNGAGKTTTIKILMNILRPTAGSAEVFGADSRHLSALDFTRIGYVSENQDMPEWMTVEYFLAYLKPFYPTWDDARAEELLRQFDLPRGRKLRHLSRGMRMKAALASSLAYRPRLMVLDEPFTGLDPLMRDEFIQGLLQNAEGLTILISSHDLTEIESFASHIGYLDSGRLQFSEEMSSLTERFREIEITLETSPELPANWPANWFKPESSAMVVRFVETRFNQEETFAEVHRLFGPVLNISAAPMPLRTIFVTLAKAGRKSG